MSLVAPAGGQNVAETGACLPLIFKRIYVEMPTCNTHGKRMRETDEFEYFHPKRLQNILEGLA